MAVTELQVVRLKEEFYKDGFYKVLIALLTILLAIASLIGLAIYNHNTKPAPVNFSTDPEFRILPPVPLDQVYLKTPDLIQWVSEVLGKLFNFDFFNFSSQLADLQQYFTDQGWQKFLDASNVFVNSTIIQNGKLFLQSSPAGAPFILNQGLLEGKYAWWVQMPINVNFISVDRRALQPLVIQALVIRSSTLNNLSGVLIDNIIITKGGGDQIRINA